MLAINKIYTGDCMKLMGKIDDGSIDMILCDLPYGTTACDWDIPLPFEPLWEHYRRIARENAAIVLTCSQPFTGRLLMSNPRDFRHEWIWRKTRATCFLSAKKRPLKNHENILVFSKKAPKYRPIMTDGKVHQRGGKHRGTDIYGFIGDIEKTRSNKYYPKTVIDFASENSSKTIHSTQKLLRLFEYLIRTYTDPGDLVLDNCIGSGTTAVAAINTGRKFIGIEKRAEFARLARLRIKREAKKAEQI